MVTPDVIETQALAVVRDHHTFALAAIERHAGLPARTVPSFQTVDLLAAHGFRLREDTPPACLLGVFGTAATPQRDKHLDLTVTWTLAVQVTAVGAGRDDVIKRRGWYATAACQALLWFLPRLADPVDALELTDMDFTNGMDEKQQRTVGEAQLLFSVRTRAALHTAAPYDPAREPGSTGGPPRDPYDPPAAWPAAQSVTATIDKEPVT
jgi:hypothetical protein